MQTKKISEYDAPLELVHNDIFTTYILWIVVLFKTNYPASSGYEGGYNK